VPLTSYEKIYNEGMKKIREDLNIVTMISRIKKLEAAITILLFNLQHKCEGNKSN